MKNKRIILGLALGVYLLGAQIWAQEIPKWQVDVYSGLSATLSQRLIDKKPLEEFNEDLQVFEGNHTGQLGAGNFSLGADINYKITDYFALNTGLQYIGLWDYRKGTSSSWSKIQRVNINLKLDALYKNPYESLNLIVGGHYALLYNRTTDIDPLVLIQTTGSTILRENYGITRTMRLLRYFSFNLGVEWRDYITPHFGYFLQLVYNPMVRTTTHRLIFEQVSLAGETHPLEGEKIFPGQDGYPQETHGFTFININLGLTYQW
jgi:hypothetical protein